MNKFLEWVEAGTGMSLPKFILFSIFQAVGLMAVFGSLWFLALLLTA
jgi:cytochrome c biogenesis protein ResB